MKYRLSSNISSTPFYQRSLAWDKNPYARRAPQTRQSNASLTVDILSSPLRFCVVSKYKYPVSLLLRFKLANGKLVCPYQSKSAKETINGKSISLLCRKSALQIFLDERLYKRLSNKASVPANFINTIERGLVEDIIENLDSITRRLRSNCLTSDVLMSQTPWLMSRQDTGSTGRYTISDPGFYLSLNSEDAFSQLVQHGNQSVPMYAFDKRYAQPDQLERITHNLQKIEEHLRRRGCNVGDREKNIFAFGFGTVSDGRLTVNLSKLAISLWRYRMWNDDPPKLESFGLHSQDVNVIK
ncbi:hypothetical protein E3Q11_03112 [Wallemia mellicola]|nr:hypothetical protein E3Q11_03112 [Wallemia mellicola]TIC73397.1 hypothetical protein E3Q00_02998 [Wallemia mellicola]